jgi:Tol biopolymer transport system component
MIEVDGAGRDFIGPGWGAQWSPDGQSIALTQGQELKIYTVATEEYRNILDRENNPYQQLFWNMGWSPDGSQLCFKGMKADGSQDIATVKVEGNTHEIKVHHSAKVAVNADFAWHPTKNRIIFAMICPERSVMQLYEFDPTKDDPPQLVKGQDETRNNTDVSWTPDGKQLIIVSGDF